MSSRQSYKHHLIKAFKRGFAESVGRLAKEFQPDFIIAEGLWAAPAARKTAKAIRVPWGITVHKLAADAAKTAFFPPLPQVLWQYEKWIYSKANRLFLVTEDQAFAMQRSLRPRPPRIHVVPNGADFAPLVSDEAIWTQRQEWHIRDDEKIALFVGRSDDMANRKGLEWFSRQVFRHVGEMGFRIRWVAAGSPRSQSTIPPFEFVGYVENLSVALAAADLCIAPVRHGMGTGIKVLDYLGAGCPVVATPQAVQGLPVERDKHLFVTSDPEEFARSVRVILMDPHLACEIAARGRDLVAGPLNWTNIAEKMFREISRALAMQESD
jgi:glycosyltransferase involved in cell wall biosynthesis